MEVAASSVLRCKWCGANGDLESLWHMELTSSRRERPLRAENDPEESLLELYCVFGR